MEEFSQEYMLSIVFRNYIDKQELLIKKHSHYHDKVKNKDLKVLIMEFS